MALNSTLDGANIDALMISSATKRDLKKMAKYAFDEGGVDCESRNQIKKSCRHSYTLRLTSIR